MVAIRAYGRWTWIWIQDVPNKDQSISIILSIQIALDFAIDYMHDRSQHHQFPWNAYTYSEFVTIHGQHQRRRQLREPSAAGHPQIQYAGSSTKEIVDAVVGEATQREHRANTFLPNAAKQNKN